MRLAISNIAWDVTEDKALAALLKGYHLDAIDIAPGKYFSKPVEATETDILKVKHWWADCGIESVSLIGDAMAPAPIAAAVYAGHKYARNFGGPAETGDELPFKREVAELLPWQPVRMVK